MSNRFAEEISARWNTSVADDSTDPTKRHIHLNWDKPPEASESYNPPTECLFSPEEEQEWKEGDWSTRKTTFVPKLHKALRLVSAFDGIVTERYERLVDSYVVSRGMKRKMNVDPASLLPVLPEVVQTAHAPNSLMWSSEGSTTLGFSSMHFAGSMGHIAYACASNVHRTTINVRLTSNSVALLSQNVKPLIGTLAATAVAALSSMLVLINTSGEIFLAVANGYSRLSSDEEKVLSGLNQVSKGALSVYAIKELPLSSDERKTCGYCLSWNASGSFLLVTVHSKNHKTSKFFVWKAASNEFSQISTGLKLLSGSDSICGSRCVHAQWHGTLPYLICAGQSGKMHAYDVKSASRVWTTSLFQGSLRVLSLCQLPGADPVSFVASAGDSSVRLTGIDRSGSVCFSKTMFPMKKPTRLDCVEYRSKRRFLLAADSTSQVLQLASYDHHGASSDLQWLGKLIHTLSDPVDRSALSRAKVTRQLSTAIWHPTAPVVALANNMCVIQLYA